MKKIFDTIKADCIAKGENRYVTNADGIQTFDDVKVVLKQILAVLDDIDKKVP